MAYHSFSSISRHKVQFCQDWVLIQYLLPCIVAAFLDSGNEGDGDVNKEQQVLFIHKLIKSYEDNSMWTSTHRNDFFGTYNMIPTHSHLALYSKCDEIWKTLLCAFPESIKRLNFEKIINEWLRNFQTDVILNRGKATIWRFLCRLRHILNECFSAEEIKIEISWSSCLLDFCRLMVYNSYEKILSDRESVDKKKDIEIASTMSSLAAQVFGFCSKFKDVSFHRLKRSRAEALTNIEEHFEKEAALLNKQQLFGIIIFLCFNFSKTDDKLLLKRKRLLSKPCIFDSTDIAFYSFIKNDFWMLKQIVSGWMNDEDGLDCSTVTHKFASQHAPVCYAIPLQEISRKMKLKMEYPGKYTFCPIKHCRWCGTVEQEIEFKVCRLCIEETEYPDRNIFCSVDCERRALDAQHEEEHARFYQVRCGIEI
jgi:hypothetical protein